MDRNMYDDPTFKLENNNNMKGAKRPGSLSLDNKSRKSALSLLSSPEKGFSIATPDLERIIMNSTSVLPGGTPVETYLLPGKPATEEQKSYVKPFEDLLAQMHCGTESSSSQVAATTTILRNALPMTTLAPITTLPNSEMMSSDTGASTSNDSYTLNTSTDSRNYDADYCPVSIKEEPQTVPQMSEGVPSPIDMRDQERIKLERKRQRNRIAASKCRKRKLERISKLEDEVSLLKSENGSLSSTISQLREQVKKLHQEVNVHMTSGCKLNIAGLTNGRLLYGAS